jgi:hypothetical protein
MSRVLLGGETIQALAGTGRENKQRQRLFGGLFRHLLTALIFELDLGTRARGPALTADRWTLAALTTPTR